MWVQTSAALDLVGYLPYYNMGSSYNNNTLPTQLGMLNEVRYFGLTVSSNGSIATQGGTLQSHKDNISLIKQKIDALSGPKPRLDITFGGAGASSNFAAIAASSSLRATFAQNIASLLNETGATAVDIDWETPTSAQYSNYVTLLHRIKQEVGATRRVYATVEPQIAISPTVLNDTDANDGFENGIDGISLMTYDLSWWANDSADPNRGEHSLPAYVTDSVDAWTQPVGSTNRRPWVWAAGAWGLGANAGDLGVGLPFYGRVIGTSQAPTGGAAHAYSELVAGGTPDASGNYYTFQGQTVWIPGPAAAAQRVQFANDRGLQQLFIWELTHDVSPTTAPGVLNTQSLLVSAFLKNQTLSGDFDGDHDSDMADFDIWRSAFGKTDDLRADGNGNGIVDSTDYVVWRKHAPIAGSGSIVNASVPEPAVTSLIGVGLFLIAGRRRP